MDFLVSSGKYRTLEGAPPAPKPAGPPGPDALRHAAWEIGERRLADCYGPPASHVGLAMVHPTGGFAYWRLLQGWVEATARSSSPECRSAATT